MERSGGRRLGLSVSLSSGAPDEMTGSRTYQNEDDAYRTLPNFYSPPSAHRRVRCNKLATRGNRGT
jgi:hypothetical protein